MILKWFPRSVWMTTKYALGLRHSHCNKLGLGLRVLQVRDCDGLFISKNCARFGKGNSMLDSIGSRLFFIPLENQSHDFFWVCT